MRTRTFAKMRVNMKGGVVVRGIETSWANATTVFWTKRMD